MEPSSAVILFSVPEAISEAEIVRYFKATLGEDCILSMQVLPVRSSDRSAGSRASHHRITLKTPELGFFVIPSSFKEFTLSFRQCSSKGCK
jgi:hypothetical protein